MFLTYSYEPLLALLLIVLTPGIMLNLVMWGLKEFSKRRKRPVDADHYPHLR